MALTGSERGVAFDAARAETIRHRARIGVVLILAIWVPASLFIDPNVFGSNYAPLLLRGPTAAVVLALYAWLRRPRPRRAVEIAATAAFSLVFAWFGPATLFASLPNALNMALSITIAAIAISTALVLSWPSTAILCMVADTAMLFPGLVRHPRPGADYFFVITTAFVVFPIVVFAAASRDRWQRSEIDAREKLSEAHEQLRREEQTRSQLFVNLSHDFRSPLGVIRSEVELLRREEPDALARLARPLARIDANAAAIVDLIEQLLELARLDAGKAPCAPGSCDVVALAREIAGQLQPPRATATLAVRADAPSISVEADPAHLRRILTNLIANALRHVGREQGHVEARVTIDDNGSPCVEVIDDGPGIAPERQATLFDRFASFQPEGSTASGIGLALARELAHMNGGELEYVATEKATTFRLALRAGSTLPAAIGAVPAPDPITLEPAHRPAPKRGGPRDLPRVLVVEDNDDLRESTTRLLSTDFEVVEAWSVSSALAALSHRAPAAIVSDIMLPDGDGYELLDIVRQGRRFERVPVLLVSALGEAADRTKGILAGADDYLAKPFSGEELRARIASAVDRSHESAAALESQREDLTMELHDGVCAKLTRAALLLTSAVQRTPGDAALGGALGEVKQGLAEARSLLGALGPKPLPFAQVIAQLRWRLAEACDRAGLTLEFSSTDDGSWALIPPAAAHALQRIASEAATNTIRHAAATKLTVNVTAGAEELRLLAEDDGQGCAAEWSPGHGLGIIRRRAAQHSGGASFGPRALGGFTLEAWLKADTDS